MEHLTDEILDLLVDAGIAIGPQIGSQGLWMFTLSSGHTGFGSTRKEAARLALMTQRAVLAEFGLDAYRKAEEITELRKELNSLRGIR